LDNERVQPLPLSGREVKNAILFKIEDELNKSGHLHDDNAYTSFRFEGSIKLVLSDYGREVQDNHEIAVAEDSGVASFPGAGEYPDNTTTVSSNVAMEPMPPNQLRVETNQSVPVTTVVDGKAKTRHVKYAPRKAKP
jgi:hypothetical protein